MGGEHSSFFIQQVRVDKVKLGLGFDGFWKTLRIECDCEVLVG